MDLSKSNSDNLGEDSDLEDSQLPKPNFPIVGIGASAGGLAAFEAFFSGMPKDREPNMAFVLVQHLAPDHKSMLAEIIQNYTKMQVYEVEDGLILKPNCAYIIPPGFDMALLNGSLQLFTHTVPRLQRLPIDFFFRSMALDQGDKAIGIVLSGTGSDGTLGIRAIQEQGGMVMVQEPKSTEYDGMPRSAIATGLADYELPPEEMVKELIAYVSHAFNKNKYLEDSKSSKSENILKKIFILVRSHTGHDFSSYKPNTTRRRIERRMSVHQINSIEEYLLFIQQSNEEINSLFKDMLIGVTNFFRDSESFKSLEETIIPKLFTGKNSGATIRIWCAGCSTGEEAYSIAILMLEYMEYLKQNFHIQIFATDIDPRAIATARSGIYPKSITADINQERIERYFSSIPNGREDGLDSYQINKNIRDMLIFSEQNIIKDPPFSRLDLISCRNLMIYLSNELQKKLIPLFHYALNPNAFLFLGTSESVSDYTDLFQSLDRKSKIYLRKENQSNVRKALIEDYYPSLHRQGNLSSGLATQKPSKRDFSPRQIAEQTLLKQLAPSSALVNSQGDIFYLHGRTGIFLEPAVGEVNGYNILKMAREGLRYEIATALRKSVMNKEIIRFTNLNVKTNGNYTNINLTICPAIIDVNNPLSELMYLVILEETNSSIQVKKDLLLPIEEIDEGIQVHNTKLIESLRSELRAKEEYLQSTTEELETANEELKSYNEEMQSVNEELQSTNEELETSKEELQSVNEELITVNNELSQKVSDLSRTNNDMNNLLAGTGIATIFVDFQLKILRFTPSASELINVISGDIGRPVNHILSKFSDYDNLALDIQSVFDTLIPKVIEVQTLIGKWFRMNILPYRTLENVIEGAVITFVDISETKRFQIDLEKREKLLKVSQRMSKVGGWEWDIDNQMMYWTEEMYTIHGFSKGKEWSDKDEPIKRSLNCFNPEDHQTILDSFQRCIDLEQPYDISLPFTSEKGNKLWVRVTGHPESKNGKVIRVIGNIMDITDSKNAEDEIKRQLSEKETLLKEVHHRIKNNIVSIESLLSLQINSSTSAIVKEALQESLSRIQSMSVLYDKLFLGNDYQEVSSKFYIESLIDAIFAVFSESKNITFKNSISDFPLNSKTVIPLGIIINELLTNIFKYSFPSKVNNHIDIVLTKIDQNVTLIIKDNGIGIDEEIINSKSTGFGLKIVEMLTRQLGGKYTVKNENGTMNTLIFKI